MATEYILFFGNDATTLAGLVGANQTYWAAATDGAYPTVTRSPFTGGYGKVTGAGTWNGADRSNSGIAPQLAGLIYNGGANADFRVKLPLGAGQYKVRAGFGDRLAARSGMNLVLRDGAGGTSLYTMPSSNTAAADNFVDILGANYTAANFIANQGFTTVTFTTDNCYIEYSANCFTNFISFESTAGGGSRMFRNNPSGHLSGLGASGPFFQNPLQRVADYVKRRGIFVPRSYNLGGI